MTIPKIPFPVFKSRRERLIQQIGDAVLFLPAAKKVTRNRDSLFSFRQDSDFLYLSNFNEADAVVVIDGKLKKSIMFSKPHDELHAIWEGVIIGQDRAKTEYLFDEAYDLELLEQHLSEYCFTHDTIISPFSRYREFDLMLLDAIQKAKDTRRARAPQQWLNSDQFIHPMRLIKDEYEIKMMTYAADVSILAHSQAMEKTKPGMYENETAAIFDYHFLKKGGTSAYNNIVASSNNACTLHYIENNSEMSDGDLLLIDAGCEISGYASDITRTFPVNGKFSSPQKRVYEWVLKSMEAALDSCKPGNSLRAPHIAAENVLIEAMIDLGLLSGTSESIKADKSYLKYFMHGTSHWIGIDVHDVGDYKDANGNWLTLEPGMAITVEPGLYIQENDTNAPKEIRGIGVRIEDDIIITDKGHINLTEKTPKTVADIEAACQ